MNILYRSESDYKQHANAIHSLAEQYHIKESSVREIYEDVLNDFQSKARLKKYLLILVTRHVKELLYKSKLISKKQLI